MFRNLCLLIVLFVLSCGAEESTLRVFVRTDFVPGAEFVEVRVTILDPVSRAARETAELGEDYLDGQQVAELTDLEPGPVVLEVELFDASRRVIAERPVQVQLGEGLYASTVLISRRCRFVDCGTDACFLGECVSAGCSEENPEACGDEEPECTRADDCPATSSCAQSVCDRDRCLVATSPNACAANEFCDPDEGCRLIPTGNDMLDAGADSGELMDAGTDAPLDAQPDVSLDAGPPDALSRPDIGPIDPSVVRSWQAASPVDSPPASWCQGSTYHSGRGTVLLYGGQADADFFYGSLWEYDGANWVELCADCLPGPRSELGMAYDPDRDVVVFLGGYHSYLSQPGFFEWDGSTWLDRSDEPGAPGPARAVSLAYDYQRRRMVAYMGLERDVYEFDGTRWEGPLGSATRPPRTMTCNRLVYVDERAANPAIRGRVVLHGVGIPRETSDEMWAWNGAEWEQICDGCTATHGFAESNLVYDSRSGQLYLYGGNWFSPVLLDSENPDGTWIYDETGFRLLGPGPPGRANAVMQYDAARDRIVLMGGRVGGFAPAPIGDTWELVAQ